MKHPKFSIIIPTYNSSESLSACLESIAIQLYRDCEVIIVDGKSEDHTLIVAQSFKQRINSMHIISEVDKGIYDAMNKGLSYARGEWLFFLGSDDSLNSNDILVKISHIVKKSSCKVIYGNVLISGDAGWANDNAVYDGEFTLKKLLKKNICHQSIFYKKEVFDKKIFDVNYRLCADYDLNIFLWSRYKFHYTPLIISNFNGGGTSSELIDIKFSEDFKNNLKRYFKLWFLTPELVYFLNQHQIKSIINRFKIMFKFLK